MGQITIRQWMLGTALFATGLTSVLTVVGLPTKDALPPWLIMTLWFGGGPLIGAGALTPFGRPILGGALGLAGQVAFTAFVILFVGLC